MMQPIQERGEKTMAVDTAQPVEPWARRMWTADEYHRMAEVGILHEDDRVELIDGAIVEMSPVGSRHIACINRLSKLLERRIGDTTLVQTQSSIRLSDASEPQPDIAVLRLRADYYADALPTPSDVLLVIEVADTSLPYDQYVKLPRYAEAGIAEVWIVDVARPMVTRYTDPRRTFYANQQHAQRGDALQSGVFPDLLLAVNEICG
jgi:Uma2 family endonuclease